MKVFISVDMEGATAMTDPEDVLPDGSDYQRGRVFVTGDANAAVLGAFDAGATEVVVNDSHWIMRNLLIEQIDPRARVIKGFHKPMCMMQGIDESVDAAVFVGYHSCAGTEQGVLATLLGKEVQNMLLNGEPTGETRLNAPLRPFRRPRRVRRRRRHALSRGEARPRRRSADLRGQGRHRHVHCQLLHPEVSQKGIREGVATAALRDYRKASGVQDGDANHVRLRVQLDGSHPATCEYIPEISKPSPYTTEFTADDMPKAMKVIFAELLLALPGRAEGDLQLTAPGGRAAAAWVPIRRRLRSGSQIRS